LDVGFCFCLLVCKKIIGPKGPKIGFGNDIIRLAKNFNFLLLIIFYFLKKLNHKKIEGKSANSNDDERLNFIFEIKHVIPYISGFKAEKNGFNDSNKITETEAIIEDCLAIFTSRFLILFKILDRKAYKLNVDFDNCLKEMLLIDLNQIETIELSKCKNYIIIENVQRGRQTEMTKFVTYDTNLTQVFLNNLISN